VEERSSFDLNASSPWVMRNAAQPVPYAVWREALGAGFQHYAIQALTQQNRFMWHSGGCPARCNLSTDWARGSISEWEQRPDWYLHPRHSLPMMAKAMASFLPKQIAGPERLRPTTRASELRISHPGAITPLHYDSSDSVLLNAEGTKEVLFFPPHTFDVYPPGHCLERRSVENLHCVPPAQRPSINVSNLLTLVLGPGDLVYFPAGWGHYIVSRTRTVSVGMRYGGNLPFTWKGRLEALALRQHIMLAERDSCWANAPTGGLPPETGCVARNGQWSVCLHMLGLTPIPAPNSSSDRRLPRSLQSSREVRGREGRGRGRARRYK